MADEELRARLEKIAEAEAAYFAARTARRAKSHGAAPGLAARALLAVVLIPFGLAVQVAAQFYLEALEGTASTALILFVGFTHIALTVSTITAALLFPRRQLFLWAVVCTLIGYGAGLGLMWLPA